MPVLLASAAFAQPGNRSLRFDGQDDLATIVDPGTTLNPPSLTLEMWIYPQSLSGFPTFFSKGSDSAGYWCHLNANGSLRWRMRTQNGLYSRDNVPMSFQVDRWTHFAFTYEGTTLKFYQDGELVFTQGFGGGAMIPNSADVECRSDD
jgi:hypothetical protein